MNNAGKNFLHLDLETTGLNPLRDRIIEVAWTTTKGDLAMPMSVFSRVISNSYTRAALERAEQVVIDMHKATGLWDEVHFEGAVSPLVPEDAKHGIVESHGSVEAEILDHLDRRSAEGETWHLCGASVHFDRSFIDNWMPSLSKRLHHRILDTSSLKLVAGAAGFEMELGIEQRNPLPHRAANDVREALGYAQGFRDLLKVIVERKESEGGSIIARAHDPKRLRGII